VDVLLALDHDAEVEQLHAALLRDDHVLGLQVAVQLAGRVHRHQPLDDLHERRAQPRSVLERGREQHLEAGDRRFERCARVIIGGRMLRQRPRRRVVGEPAPAVHVREQVFALDVLHREEPLVADREQLVQSDQILVCDIRDRAELVLEAVDAGRIDAEQHLERDLVAELLVVREVHGAHAAGAQLALDDEAVRACKNGLHSRT
jgi:hypothetical protein